jgi:hypothetical protein
MQYWMRATASAWADRANNFSAGTDFEKGRAGEAEMGGPQPARGAHCAPLSESLTTKPGRGTSL